MPAPSKKLLGVDVLTAARQRVAWTFDTFPRIYVSFSGGKDSTVVLHLVMEEAARRGRKVGLLFIDWEAQFRLTVEHVRRCFDLYADLAEPFWVALPLTTTNACSQFEPEWTCWEPGKEWVRQPPGDAVTSLPFHAPGMTFEEFVPAFGRWYGGGVLTACVVGIRTGESLNRWRAVAAMEKHCLEGKRWTTWNNQEVVNCYPIYDWRVEDIWTYHGRHPGKPHNMLYDLMHRAGLTPHQMRVCEPYGDEQRRGLWLYHVIEPETWGKVVARVAGANTGALYAGERGNVLGNGKVFKPEGHTWESFARLLLDTMPQATAEHYRNKIAVYLHVCMTRYGGAYSGGLPEEAEGDTGGKDVPSWRRICKVLLKNDYWCKGLSFNPTKAGSYWRYKKIMDKRRRQWGLI